MPIKGWPVALILGQIRRSFFKINQWILKPRVP